MPDRTKLMRIIYSILWWLMLPGAGFRLWLLGRRDPGYRRHVSERFGFYPGLGPNTSEKVLWIHAVSLGETRAAEPVIQSLLSAYPERRILLTHMTPTGRSAGKAIAEKHPARIIQSYCPYDVGWIVSRFLKHFSPGICVLMETEVWPTMISQCVRRGVPVFVANARLSERSYKKAQRLPGLFREAARNIAYAAAQTEDDAQRLRKIGVAQVQVTGSVKFDVTPPYDAIEQGMRLRTSFGSRQVLLCASTREGEEALILDAYVSSRLRNTLLLIVPRHPQRFNEVQALIERRGLRMRRRSSLGNDPIPADVSVVLGDSMGEMFAYYTACDLAFIGGSLLPLGGQNLIEACAVGKPVLIGPHTFNFAEVAENAIAAGAAIRVKDAGWMLNEAGKLLEDAGSLGDMGSKAAAFAAQHRGATQRTLQLLCGLLEQAK